MTPNFKKLKFIIPADVYKDATKSLLEFPVLCVFTLDVKTGLWIEDCVSPDNKNWRFQTTSMYVLLSDVPDPSFYFRILGYIRFHQLYLYEAPLIKTQSYRDCAAHYLTNVRHPRAIYLADRKFVCPQGAIEALKLIPVCDIIKRIRPLELCKMNFFNDLLQEYTGDNVLEYS